MNFSPDWRTFHCADLAAQSVKEESGRDIWQELGGSPRSWRDAAVVYRRLKVRSLADAVSAVLGPPIPILRAMRGDVVMVQGSLGVCRGDLAECLGAVVSMGEAELAWSAKGATWGK